MAGLLVNADDFGLHPAVNAAIEKCMHAGSVNSVSVIANCASPDYELLKSFRIMKVFIGVHLTWVGEPWITEPITFFDWKALAAHLLWGGKSFRLKMQHEAKAQIDRLIENGITPDHIDSHQHIHHMPGIWNITMELKNNYSIPRIRTACVRHASIRRANFPGSVLNALACSKQKEANGLFCAGIKHAGNYNYYLLANELNACKDSDTELIVHPGTSNKSLNKLYGHWNFDWEKELTALLNPAFTDCVAGNGFSLSRKEQTMGFDCT